MIPNSIPQEIFFRSCCWSVGVSDLCILTLKTISSAAFFMKIKKKIKIPEDINKYIN